MSEQNKNTSTTPGGTTGKSEENKRANPSTDPHDQSATKTPNHEQGREHVPNVNAQNEAADARRKTEQARVPTSTSNVAEKPSGSANDRLENEAGDAHRTTQGGQGDRKTGNEPGNIVASNDSSGKS